MISVIMLTSDARGFLQLYNQHFMSDNITNKNTNTDESEVVYTAPVKVKLTTAQFDLVGGRMVDLFAKQLINAGFDEDEFGNGDFDEDIELEPDEINISLSPTSSDLSPKKRTGINNKQPDNQFELFTEAQLTETADGKIKIEYDETEISGMEGSTTSISFEKKNPELVTMLRGGAVYTALVFEAAKRHICAYETQYMPFELCVYTVKTKNTISRRGGKIILDYFVQIRGASAQRTKMTLEIIPIKNNK